MVVPDLPTVEALDFADPCPAGWAELMGESTSCKPLKLRFLRVDDPASMSDMDTREPVLTSHCLLCGAEQKKVGRCACAGCPGRDSDKCNHMCFLCCSQVDRAGCCRFSILLKIFTVHATRNTRNSQGRKSEDEHQVALHGPTVSKSYETRFKKKVYQRRVANPPSELRNKLPLKVASHFAPRAKVLGGRLESTTCKQVDDKAHVVASLS